MTASEERDVAEALAAAGLPGSMHQLPHEPLDERSWTRFLKKVQRERLSGLLIQAIGEDLMAVDDEQVEQAVELHLGHVRHVLLLERRLLEAVDGMAAAGVEVRVLKGAALAHVLYKDPSMRLYGDVDLLVRTEQYDTAKDVLRDLGAQPPLPPLRADFERRFGKGATFVCEDDLEIDLHRLLVPGFYGLQIDADTLFERPEPLTLANRTISTLTPELHLLHACYHAAIGHLARSVSLRDIAELATSPDIDTDRVVRLARSWDGEAVVARAVRLAWERLRIERRCEIADWAHDYEVAPDDRRRMAAYRGARAREASRGLDALAVIPSLRGRTAFLRALLFPDREYLDAVGTGRLRWLRRGATSLWRGLRA